MRRLVKPDGLAIVWRPTHTDTDGQPDVNHYRLNPSIAAVTRTRSDSNDTSFQLESHHSRSHRRLCDLKR